MSEMLTSPRIMQELTATRADLERDVFLSEGLHVACRQRHTLQDTAYLRPGHHTLSCYLAGGEQIRRRDQPTLRGGPGKLCLLPAEHESHWQVGGYIHFLHLYFTPQHLAHQIVALFDCEPRGIALADRTYMDDPRLTQACQQLYRFDWQQDLGRLAAQTLAQEMTAYLLQTQAGRRAAPVKGGLSPYQQRLLQEWMQSHLGKSVTLAEMASTVALSEFHFARMFKLSFGMPPHAWLLQQRLLRARSWLQRDAQADLQTVAQECGFTNSSLMSRHFRRWLGMAPGQYRQLNARLPQDKNRLICQ